MPGKAVSKGLSPWMAKVAPMDGLTAPLRELALAGSLALPHGDSKRERV
ncbi:hypothetical protein [Halomonas sp. HAL1]|nr:hypothetical protein [Halomonas sp. HAL1]WKV93450.1 hypothetical protein Q3Y66_02095 [Halomonas sp. HAL1]